MFGIIIYGIIIGAIAGLSWGFGLGADLLAGLKIGSIAGVIVGILFTIFGKAATLGGNVNKSEAVFVSSSMITVLAVLATVSGLIVWIIRLVF